MDLTIDEIRSSEKVFLFPEDVAKLLGVKAQSIRNQAKTDPRSFPFPVIVVGTRTLIPRMGFVDFYTKSVGGG